MPERQLTSEQHRAVEFWIEGKGGHWNHSFNEGIIGSGVYRVDGEPLIMHGFPNGEPQPEPSVSYKIFCSDKHAQELEAAGIIKFAEEPQILDKPE